MVVKNPPANEGDARDAGLISGWKDSWGRQPTPVLLPGKSHGRRSLVGYSPGSCKELDLTERLDTHVFQRKMLFYERVGYFSLQLKTAYVLEYSC